MGTSFLTQWLSDHEIKAICWTLIHSLWIGLIIAALAGLVITFTRKSAADVRYRLLCGVLVLFILSVSITFYVESRSAVAGPANPDHVNVVISYSDGGIVHHTNAVAPISTSNKALNFLNLHINVVFLLWLLFFAMKSLKMMGGLLYIQRLRSYKVHEVAEEFKHKIELFSRQIGIGRTVRLVQSELVKVPVAVGWLKPVVLLPIGIILQLSTEQLESILWHELAHIRRRDYLVNILQGLVETVFFFNPGLLWLSSLIRDEREACCDDIVLGQMSQKANYLEALLSFGFEGNKQAGLAMGIGSGSQLRDRLKRMISQENKRLGVVEKIALLTGIVILSAFAGLPATSKNVVKLVRTETVKSGASMKAQPIAAAQKQPLLSKMDEVAQVTGDPFKKADTSVNLLNVQYKWSQSEPGSIYYIFAQDAAGNKYHFTLSHSSVTQDKLLAMTLNGNDIQKRDLQKYVHLLKHVPPPPPPAPLPPNAPLTKADTAMHSVNVQYEPIKSNHVSVQDDHSQSLDKMISDLTGDLVNESVLKDKSSLSTFKLTNTELVVNGAKQPDDVQKKLSSKYLKSPSSYAIGGKFSDDPNYGLYYNAKTHGVALGSFNLDLEAL